MLKECSILLLILLCGRVANAAAPNKTEFDGRIIEYDTADLRGTFAGTPAWPGSSVSNLYVTWDETNLYIALQCRMSNTKISVLLDVDPGRGTGATTTTNWAAANNVLFYYNDTGWRASSAPGAKPFGLDFMVATEGFYNSVALVLYDGIQIPTTNTGKRMFDLPDIGNGSTPVGTAIEMVVLKDSTENPIKGFETRIPWNIIYGANTNRFGVVQPGHLVPTGATVRLFANIHNNVPNNSFSAPDTIPAQTSSNASYLAGSGLLVTDDYLDVVIDQDADGFPDTATGDVNAPYLTRMIGVAGATTITGYFNEAVSASSVNPTSHWSVAGFNVLSTELRAPNRVVVTLNDALPAAGSMLVVQTHGIEDLSGNHRTTLNTLFTRASAYLSGFTNMSVAGDFQGWNPEAKNMMKIGDYTWLYDTAILSSNGIQFKFAANGSWSNNFGRGSPFTSTLPLIDSAGTPGGANIQVTNSLSGTYRFLFNEQSRIFKLVQSGTDSDGDHLPDEWEILYALNPADNGSGSMINGASGDQDADGLDNASEYISDTDPSDTFSALALQAISRTTSGTAMTFPTSTNRIYRIESSPLTFTPAWSALASGPIIATNYMTTVTDTNLTDNLRYRIKVYLP